MQDNLQLPWSQGWELPLPRPFPSVPTRPMAAPARSHCVQLLPSSFCVVFPTGRGLSAEKEEGWSTVEQSRWEAENKPCDAKLILASSLPCAGFNHIIAV